MNRLGILNIGSGNLNEKLSRIGNFVIILFFLSMIFSVSYGSELLTESSTSLGTESLMDSENAPSIEVNFNTGDEGVASSIQILVLLTILSIAPSILLMTTCFTRFIIVLGFLRKGMSLQTTPPNQVIIGLALFLTFFVMSPVLTEVYEEAYLPYSDGEISTEEFIETALDPVRDYMFRQVKSKDLALFMELGQVGEVESQNDIPTTVLIPAYMLSEIKIGFEIGFLLFIPFIVVDMIVASTLMALGMMMLPPVMISLPIKVLIFILVDGWTVVIEQMILGIR